MGGRRFASRCINPEDAAGSVAAEKSTIRARASVAAQCLSTSGYSFPNNSSVIRPSARSNKILLAGSNSNRKAMRTFILPASSRSGGAISPLTHPVRKDVKDVKDVDVKEEHVSCPLAESSRR
jgi:hypothetical protein